MVVVGEGRGTGCIPGQVAEESLDDAMLLPGRFTTSEEK
jgi:hypothetical protein